MFTGLIKEIGQIESLTPNPTGMNFHITCPVLRPEIGIDDSIATNGVCLTATKLSERGFWCQAVHTTLEKTNLGSLSKGNKVNLELALRVGDRLGGHFVQGHVNSVARHLKSIKKGDNFELWFELPVAQARYLIKEGSIAINGISLTIADLTREQFCVSIIPHTWHSTTLGMLKVGQQVNIEVDMLAKYIENFSRFDKSPAGLSLERMNDLGF
jgi:riboflavin synthase